MALLVIGILAALVLVWRAAQPIIIRGVFAEEYNNITKQVCADRPGCKSIKVRAEYDREARRWVPVLELQIGGNKVTVADAQKLANQFIETATSKMWIMRFYANAFVVRANGVRISRG
jgi:hypothetical protein